MDEARQPIGWAWFDRPEGATSDPPDAPDPELCRAFARCFSGADGERVMRHLERAMRDRRLPPQASDAELRHLEGQRYAVAYLSAMVDRGRS